jgi:hypothetical protein
MAPAASGGLFAACVSRPQFELIVKFHGLVHGMHGMHHVQETKLSEGLSSPPPPRGPVEAVGDGATFILGQVEEYLKPHVKDLPLSSPPLSLGFFQ